MVIPPAIKSYFALVRKTRDVSLRNALLSTRKVYEGFAGHWYIVLEAGKPSIPDNLPDDKLVVLLIGMVDHDDLGTKPRIVLADIRECARSPQEESLFI